MKKIVIVGGVFLLTLLVVVIVVLNTATQRKTDASKISESTSVDTTHDVLTTKSTPNVLTDQATSDAPTPETTTQPTTSETTSDISNTQRTTDASATDITTQPSISQTSESTTKTLPDFSTTDSTTHTTTDTSTTQTTTHALTTLKTANALTTQKTADASTTHPTSVSSTNDSTIPPLTTQLISDASTTQTTTHASTIDLTTEPSTTQAASDRSTSESTIVIFQQNETEKIKEEVNFKKYFIKVYKLQFNNDNSTTNITHRTRRAIFYFQYLIEAFDAYKQYSKGKKFKTVSMNGTTDQKLELIVGEIWSRVGKSLVTKVVEFLKKGGQATGGTIGGFLGMAMGAAIPPLRIPLTIGGVFIGKKLGEVLGHIAGKTVEDTVMNYLAKLTASNLVRPLFDFIKKEIKELSTSSEITCRSDICSRGYAEENCKCIACNGPMEYSDKDGLPSCNTCPIGSYPKNSRYCINCPVGTFGENDGKCYFCNGPMQYNDEKGADSCKTCPLGSIPDSGKRFYNSYHKDQYYKCTKCSTGTFWKNDGKCYKCNGTMEYSDVEGSTSCKTCSIGSYPSHYSRNCINCPVGTFGKNDGKCYFCNRPMQYNDEKGADSCKICPLGSIPDSSYRMTSDGKYYYNQCIKCSTGYYGKNDGLCHKCNGTMEYSDVEGSTSCKTCPVGSIPDSGYRITSDGTYIYNKCSKCSKGYYGKNDGLCHKCNGAMQFSDVEGSTSCKTCPLGSIPNVSNRGCVKCAKGSIGKK